MRLERKYKEIWDLAKPYLAKCRLWDLWHTQISISFLYQIMKQEGKEELENILVPAIILHDIGWSTIGEEKNISWQRKKMRVKHMKAGAKIAKEILEEVDYDQELIKKIVRLVSTHDNAYLGITQNAVEEKLMRDADACFVFTDLSFWKDYHVTNVIKGVRVTPRGFLKKLVENNSLRHTKTAKGITNQQIIDRTKEIEDTSKTPLQRYEKLKAKAEKRNEETIGV